MYRMTSEAASETARKRWARIPVEERSRHVPHNGGPKRIHPKCPRYGSHHFKARGRCPCGYVRK